MRGHFLFKLVMVNFKLSDNTFSNLLISRPKLTYQLKNLISRWAAKILLLFGSAII